MTTVTQTWSLPVRATLGFAIAMTTIAEAVYFLIWGVLLFPAGNFVDKLLWTATCAIAMGVIIASIVILAAPTQRRGAFVIAAMSMAIVGVTCTLLCSWIDTRFNYFGGVEAAELFVFAGVIPAVIGGLLFGWLITSRAANPVRRLVGEVR